MMTHWTIEKALRYAAQHIPKQEARWLLEKVTSRPYASLVARSTTNLSVDQTQQFVQWTDRIAAGEPFAYVIEEAIFRERRFKVNGSVLIPRPETELLIDLALGPIQQLAHPKVLDLGTGSGIIAITLALEAPHAEIHAADISTDALEVARQNAQFHQVSIQWFKSDWLEKISTNVPYDVIVTNPPYIAKDDTHLAALQHEPRIALVSENDGYHDLHRIIEEATSLLSGWLFCEHGYTQSSHCRTLFRKAGYTDVTSWKDMFGHPRVTGGRYATSIRREKIT